MAAESAPPDYYSRGANIGVPGHFAPITPSDTIALPPGVLSLYVGGTGDLAVVGVLDTLVVLFKAVPVGTTIHGRFKYVMATNTTATLIVAAIN